MSEKQHARDVKKLGAKLHQPPCLNRHISAYEDGNTCSHRWQAFLNAEDHSTLYNDKNWGTKKIDTAARLLGGIKLWPPWYKTKLTPPPPDKKDGWNVGVGSNFKEKCNIPYWHNGHHMVPNAELRAAIADTGKGKPRPATVVWGVREGLLEAGYNLNDKPNMFVLPMDKKIGEVLPLPIHLKTATARSHGAYSKNVATELKVVFAKVKAKLQKHTLTKADYTSLKDGVVALSERLQPAIIAAGKAGVKHLDTMDDSYFKPPK